MENLPEKPKNRFSTVLYTLLMVAAPVAYGIAAFIIFRQFFANQQSGDVASLAFLVFVPMGIGIISAFVLPIEKRTPFRMMALAALITVVFIVTTGIIFSGLWLCLLMIAPFVLIPAVIGSLIVWGIGKLTQRKRHYAFAGFALLLPYLLAPLEANTPLPDWTRTVTDTIEIEGTPEQVWLHIIRMDEITPEEQRPSFYQAMGIPRPVRATLDREGIGGIRTGEFEYGLAFDEIITVWQPEQAVRFTVDVRHNPQSTPVLMQIGGRYFDILEAGYQIEVVDAGTVRLTLDSSYRLSTNFNFYGVVWADWMMHDFQHYVLQTVKQRVEG